MPTLDVTVDPSPAPTPVRAGADANADGAPSGTRAPSDRAVDVGLSGAADGGDGDDGGAVWGWVVLAVVLALAITAAAVAAGGRKRQRDRQLLDYDLRMRGGGAVSLATNDAYRPGVPSQDRYGALGGGGDRVGGHVEPAPPGQGDYVVLHEPHVEGRLGQGPTPATATAQCTPLYEVSDYDGTLCRLPRSDADGYEVAVDDKDTGIYAPVVADDAITVVYAGNVYAIPIDATDA